MKHASTRALYAYWNERRGTRPAPERADIDPVGIRHELGDVFMLAADFVDGLRFRLAGTRVCALFGREIKGESFSALWDETARKTIDDQMEVVTAEFVGAVFGLTGKTADDAAVELEMILLPLAHSGLARIRALGALVPLVQPYWLGAKPVERLELRALRHIGGAVENFEAPAFALAPSQDPEAALPPARGGSGVLAPAGAQRRHGFVVYSGGRVSPSGDEPAD